MPDQKAHQKALIETAFAAKRAAAPKEARAHAMAKPQAAPRPPASGQSQSAPAAAAAVKRPPGATPLAAFWANSR